MADENAGITDPSLPNELQGKTAAEIAEYYRTREANLQAENDRLRTAALSTPPPPPPPPSEPPTGFDWSNPEGYIKKQTISREEFQQATAAVRQQMIQTARFLAKANHPDWDKWGKDIDNIMMTMNADAQANQQQWEVAYTHVKGQAFDKEVAAARAAALKQGSEPPSPPPSAPPKATELTPEQARIASRFGLSKEQYLKAEEGLATGKWPLTFDNKGGK